MSTNQGSPSALYSKQELIDGLGLNRQNETRPAVAKILPFRKSAGPGLPPELDKVCGDGERTAHLTRLAGVLYSQGRDPAEVLELALAWNEKNSPPLEPEKVVYTCNSILRTHQKNHPEAALSEDALLFELDEATVGQMLAVAPPPRRWLLENCLPYGKVGGIVAPGGTGKSQFLLQLGVSVATGLPFLEHWRVSDPGGVLILAAEDDAEEIHRRLHSIVVQTVAHNHDTSNIHDLVRSRLYIRSMLAMDNLMTKVSDVSRHVEITNYGERLIRTALQIKDLRLIVVDPASRFRGGDENSAQDTTRFVEALEHVRQKTGVNVLVAHHTNKWSSSSEEASQHASRGSSALVDGMRWQMNLTPVTKQAAKAFGIAEDARRQYLQAEIVKNNYGPPTEPVLLKRFDGGYLSRVVLEDKTEANDAVLLAGIKAQLRKESLAGATFTRTSFEEVMGGEHGPLKIGKVTLRKKLKEFVAKGELYVGKDKLLSDSPMGSGIKASSDTKATKTKR